MSSATPIPNHDDLNVSEIVTVARTIEDERLRRAEVVIMQHGANIVQRLTAGLTLNNVTQVCIHAMQLANEIEGLTGADKKQVVIAAMLQAARKIDPRDDGAISAQAVLETVLVETLPGLIDWLIIADRQQLSLNPVIEETVERIPHMCFPCCGSQVTTRTTIPVRPVPEISAEMARSSASGTSSVAASEAMKYEPSNEESNEADTLLTRRARLPPVDIDRLAQLAKRLQPDGQ
jgi:hypothetical protein